jgi:isopropylmalate/homocitrate/citramalate synthase
LKAHVPEASITVNLLAAKPDWPKDLASASAARPDAIFVMYRTGAAQFRAMGLSRRDAVGRITDAIRAAKSAAPTVGFAGTFTTLAEEDLLREFFGAAADAGARHFKASDSTGVANPDGITYLVRLLRDATGNGSIGLHCHNDFGLGLANALAGLRAGADTVDATIAGLGERAGLVAVDELALSLEWQYGVHTEVRIDRLQALADFYSSLTGVPIPATKPVTGEDAFTHQLDGHIALGHKDPSLIEPFDPELLGRTRKLKLGAGTGPIAVRAKAEELGLPTCSEDRALDLARWVNREAIRRRSSIPDEDFRAEYAT